MSSTPVKAIRAYCLTVCPYSAANEGLHGVTWRTRAYAVAQCDREECPLHCYRLGTNPARAGIGGRPAAR